MSAVGETFKQTFGEPDPPEPVGVRFSKNVAEMVWQELQQEVGAGWFVNRFVYLFGEALEQLAPCLDAWSFLFEREVNRVIIGKNAYGALLVMEEPEIKGINAPVGLIDPWQVRYWQAEDVGFINLIGRWLPDNLIPNFLDTRLYEGWQQATDDFLEFLEILAIKVPLPMGGEIEADNFQVENILDYYQTTGAIYRKALE